MLFKREPSFWLGLVQAVLSLLVALKVVHLNDTQTGLVLAVVSGVIGIAVALSVKPFQWPLLSGLASAVVALVVGLGFNVDQGTQGAILTVVSFVVLAFNRSTVTPEVSLPASFPVAATQGRTSGGL